MTWTSCKIETCECFITSQSNAVLNDLKELGFSGLVQPDDWEKFGKFIDEGNREVIEILREGQTSKLKNYIKKKLFFKLQLDQRRIKDNPSALEELKWQQINMAKNYHKNQEKKKITEITYDDDLETLN